MFNTFLLVGGRLDEHDHCAPLTLKTYPKDADPALVASAPMFCYPDRSSNAALLTSRERNTFQFILTNKDGRRSYAFCRYVGNSSPLPFCFVFMSTQYWADTFFSALEMCEEMFQNDALDKFLDALFNCATLEPGSTATIPIETKSVEALTFKLAVPPPMLCPLRNVPFPDISLAPLLRVFDSIQLVQIFECILQEQHILVAHDNVAILSRVVLAIAGLLMPFEWQGPIIPVLPHAMLDYVCAPIPYLIGVPLSLLTKALSLPIDEVIVAKVERGRCSLSRVGSFPSARLRAALPRTSRKILERDVAEICDKHVLRYSLPQDDTPPSSPTSTRADKAQSPTRFNWRRTSPGPQATPPVNTPPTPPSRTTGAPPSTPPGEQTGMSPARKRFSLVLDSAASGRDQAIAGVRNRFNSVKKAMGKSTDPELLISIDDEEGLNAELRVAFTSFFERTFCLAGARVHGLCIDVDVLNDQHRGSHSTPLFLNEFSRTQIFERMVAGLEMDFGIEDERDRARRLKFSAMHEQDRAGTPPDPAKEPKHATPLPLGAEQTSDAQAAAAPGMAPLAPAVEDSGVQTATTELLIPPAIPLGEHNRPAAQTPEARLEALLAAPLIPSPVASSHPVSHTTGPEKNALNSTAQQLNPPEVQNDMPGNVETNPAVQDGSVGGAMGSEDTPPPNRDDDGGPHARRRAPPAPILHPVQADDMLL